MGWDGVGQITGMIMNLGLEEWMGNGNAANESGVVLLGCIEMEMGKL